MAPRPGPTRQGDPGADAQTGVRRVVLCLPWSGGARDKGVSVSPTDVHLQQDGNPGTRWTTPKSIPAKGGPFGRVAIPRRRTLGGFRREFDMQKGGRSVVWGLSADGPQPSDGSGLKSLGSPFSLGLVRMSLRPAQGGSLDPSDQVEEDDAPKGRQCYGREHQPGVDPVACLHDHEANPPVGAGEFGHY